LIIVLSTICVVFPSISLFSLCVNLFPSFLFSFLLFFHLFLFCLLLFFLFTFILSNLNFQIILFFISYNYYYFIVRYFPLVVLLLQSKYMINKYRWKSVTQNRRKEKIKQIFIISNMLRNKTNNKNTIQ